MISDRKQREEAIRAQESEMMKNAAADLVSADYDFLKYDFIKSAFPPTTNQEFINDQ